MRKNGNRNGSERNSQSARTTDRENRARLVCSASLAARGEVGDETNGADCGTSPTIGSTNVICCCGFVTFRTNQHRWNYRSRELFPSVSEWFPGSSLAPLSLIDSIRQWILSLFPFDSFMAQAEPTQQSANQNFQVLPEYVSRLSNLFFYCKRLHK